MHRVGDDARAGLQQPRRLRVEEVGVAADFVHRPVDALSLPSAAGVATAWSAADLRPPDHVMEHEAAADGLPAVAVARVDVVDFLHSSAAT